MGEARAVAAVDILRKKEKSEAAAGVWGEEMRVNICKLWLR